MSVPRASLVAAIVGVVVAGCGGGGKPNATARPSTSAVTPVSAVGTTSTSTRAAAPPPPAPPAPPRISAGALGTGATQGFLRLVTWHGRAAVRVARTATGVTLLALDQRVLGLHLHSGTVDAGTAGWRFGPAIRGLERSRVIAAFNGGFRLPTGAGGFVSYGHVAVPVRDGLGSVVTYTDGTTDIGSWGSEVLAHGRRLASIRQNLTLLVDHGHAASTTDCLSCWGATLGGVADPARSALGVTADGTLVWAGGENVTVATLADALLSAHVVRAVELDINPEWVNAYVYDHHGGHGAVTPVAVMPGQQGIPGQFLAPWVRDFFAVVER